VLVVVRGDLVRVRAALEKLYNLNLSSTIYGWAYLEEFSLRYPRMVNKSKFYMSFIVRLVIGREVPAIRE
jgi:hypothetical protein